MNRLSNHRFVVGIRSNVSVNVTSAADLDSLAAQTEDKPAEAEADLRYVGIRHFDPTVGRWLSCDALGFEESDDNLRQFPAG